MSKKEPDICVDVVEDGEDGGEGWMVVERKKEPRDRPTASLSYVLHPSMKKKFVVTRRISFFGKFQLTVGRDTFKLFSQKLGIHSRIYSANFKLAINAHIMYTIPKEL
jgi:hypothetical protein